MSTAETVDQTTDAESVEPSFASLTEQVRTTLPMATEQELRAEIQRRHPGPDFRAVRYGVTVNTGNYSSVRVDAEVAVPTGSSAESTLQELREWVLSQSPLNEYDREALLDRTNRLRQEVRAWEDKAADAQREWEKMRKAFKTLGIEPGLPSVEDLPF